MNDKTVVMKFLDQKKIKYVPHYYEGDGTLSGIDVAKLINIDHRRVFKTLVTVGKSNRYYVFVLPVDNELDLKKAAKVVGEKSIEMLKSKDLLGLTGYIHGGCSPLKMKKEFKTTIDIDAKDFETIVFSAGKIGYQVELSVEDLNKVLKFEVADIKIV